MSETRIREAIAACPVPLAPLVDDEQQDLVLLLGPDVNGVPLEVVAVELASGDLIVIHAMRLRRSLVAAYAEVMRWA
jgi:hypothetical protein